MIRAQKHIDFQSFVEGYVNIIIIMTEVQMFLKTSQQTYFFSLPCACLFKWANQIAITGNTAVRYLFLASKMSSPLPCPTFVRAGAEQPCLSRVRWSWQPLSVLYYTCVQRQPEYFQPGVRCVFVYSCRLESSGRPRDPNGTRPATA